MINTWLPGYYVALDTSTVISDTSIRSVIASRHFIARSQSWLGRSGLAGFGYATIPNLHSLPGQDPTYSLHWPNANEFFFQCDHADIPWEAALDETGGGLIVLPRGHYLHRMASLSMREMQKQAGAALTKLKETALSGGNIFAELMDTVRVASLGQITKALYEVGGKYRRNM